MQDEIEPGNLDSENFAANEMDENDNSENGRQTNGPFVNFGKRRSKMLEDKCLKMQ